MRTIGTTLLVAALLGAQPAQAATVPELTDAVNETLRKLPVEPPPQLPELQLPELPLPTPVPEAPPLPPPVAAPPPEAAPPPAAPDPPRAAEPAAPAAAQAAATQAEPAASAPAQPVQGAPPRAEGGGRQAPPDSRPARATPDRPESRPARTRTAPDRDAAPARRSRAATARVELAPAASVPDEQREPGSRASSPPPSFASRVADEVGEIVRTMPAAILWALVGSAAIALALAGNSFRQSRRRKALEAQRAELLDDIGLLSGALLPPVPEHLDGVAVSAAYRPADGPAAGGDFYDVFELEDQRVGVLLGDVSGHGRRSVTQAALARYTLRTLLAAGHPPGAALARADELLMRELDNNFVTVIACVLDRATGELTYAKAGHAPPIVLGAAHDPDGERPAPPIGLGFGDVWPEFTIELREGVSVCLFTDGLEDARLGAGRVGRAEVARLLGAHEVPSANRLIDDLEAFADLMSDDAAAVVLSHAAPLDAVVSA
jgi:hypothetical protein